MWDLSLILELQKHPHLFLPDSAGKHRAAGSQVPPFVATMSLRQKEQPCSLPSTRLKAVTG